ncbi:DEAD/DEAH box helicase family protein [Micromonospora sp. 4G57]|uniref:DEAD/DEAH box helicase family protein n=1 Tax=Micromonospora sicca TaxID=2202420 RepID=A0ABU5JNV3_9ACTN|nr:MULTISPECIES: DEAD/DEAH box helicase family protein [unclassified Micromonospora]MDZ5447377.1 DEAD/DEAH box helicase family protein [Micromonospora sp. 4G57]MDZ5494058.1 DEAD/DEAH box helicase family protein [Micromonospora sp. 4G53]
MSNFAFLRAEWPVLFGEALRAERLAIADPRASCFYARRTLELALTWLFQADSTLTKPYKDDLSAMIHEPSLRSLVGNSLQAKMNIVRKQGNTAVHKSTPVTPKEAVPVVRELFHVMYWIARHYTRDQAKVPASALAFNPDLIPRPIPSQVRQQSQAELKALADKLAAQDAALAAEREKSATLDAELAKLRAEIAAAKAANEARPDDHDYDEAQTRDLYIDLMLREAGWRLDRPEDREFEVTGMPNSTGTGYVDYVLWGDDGKPLAVVEAKRTRRDATVGQQQAKLYANCLEQRYGQRPVIFYTNGYETWLWDDTAYPPRPMQGFYTKEELQLLIQRRDTRKPLADVLINQEIVERYYQHRAIRNIGEAFETQRQRQVLVVMATGAGKTRTVIALVDLLMRANWVKRVLFLADRNALVNQAVNAFKAHLPEAATVNLVTEKNTEGRVYVSTYPTMMGLINETASGERRFGPGYFDLVIIDEAHRSVYQKYRAIFSWFDSLLVGLTATPRNEIDRNTYSLFNLEDGVPTDHYDLDDAVNEAFLVPPRAVSVPLKFQRDGIRYDDLTEEEKDDWDALDWGEDGPPDSVDPDAVNKWLFNADTVDKVLATLMTHGHHVAGGDRIGKTIIFAKNNAHADFIQKRFDLAYPMHRGHLARVITHKTEYAQSLIDDFSEKEKDPHIAISVDMLDTGIDVPEVVNLVFFKIVRSKSKFWQMIGRGTRLCKDLYGPGQDKQDFFIFDFCQNFEFFNHNPKAVEGTLGESLTERLFKAQLELIYRLDQRLPSDANPEAEVDGTQSEAALRWDLARNLHRRVENIHLDNFVVRPKRRLVEYYVDFKHWHRLTPEAVDEIGGNLAGLPTAVKDEDEAAKRFDLMVLRLQLGQLDVEPAYDRLRRQVQDIASTLLEQTSIPAIREQQQLLDEVAGDEWWQDLTLPMLELMRRRLRGLVKLIERSKRAIVYTDFTDELGEISVVTLNDIKIGTDFERFRAKARVYLRAHEDHLALQKLRRNKQLSPSDLDELERMLAASGGGTEDIDQARRSAHGLGLFIRSLVGLDREAATEAFGEFLAGRTLTANQINFVNLIITHLTQNGVMEPERLYESPFSEIAPHGPDSIFPSADVDRLITILNSVRDTAAPAAEVA